MSAAIDLAGKRAIVTGGARGIGLAIAGKLLSAGASVTLWDRDAPALDAAVKRLAGQGDVYTAEVDLTDENAVAAATNRSVGAMGGIDILVNNAGGVFAPEFAARTMALNLDAPIALIRAAWPTMTAAKAGSIVNLSSYVTAHAASPRLADYAVAKAGLEQATRNFAKLGAPHGIRANAVRPGFVDTDLNRWADDPDRSAFAVRAARVPVGRAATAEEIAAAIVFLAGPMSSYTTGTVLTVAGGE